MSTLNKITYDIRQMYKDWSDDSEITNDYLEYQINIARAVLIQQKFTPVKSVLYAGRSRAGANVPEIFLSDKYQNFNSIVNPLGRHPFNIITEEIYG